MAKFYTFEGKLEHLDLIDWIDTSNGVFSFSVRSNGTVMAFRTPVLIDSFLKQ